MLDRWAQERLVSHGYQPRSVHPTPPTSPPAGLMAPPPPSTPPRHFGGGVLPEQPWPRKAGAGDPPAGPAPAPTPHPSGHGRLRLSSAVRIVRHTPIPWGHEMVTRAPDVLVEWESVNGKRGTIPVISGGVVLNAADATRLPAGGLARFSIERWTIQAPGQLYEREELQP